MKTITGTARVTARGLALASLTSATVGKLKLRRRLRGACARSELAAGQRWARRSARALGLDIRVHGAPPEGGRVLLLANHRSYIDIVALLTQVPCAFLAKAQIGTWPIFGTAARLQGTVFVERECPVSRKAAREGALAALERGLPFAAFPEGTTFRGPGTLPFFRGLFEVAAANDVPVVPVALEYGDPADAWVDDDTFLGHFAQCFHKPRTELHLHFGLPLRASCPTELHERTETWIRARLEEALPRLRSAHGAGAMPGSRPAPMAVHAGAA